MWPDSAAVGVTRPPAEVPEESCPADRGVLSGRWRCPVQSMEEFCPVARRSPVRPMEESYSAAVFGAIMIQRNTDPRPREFPAPSQEPEGIRLYLNMRRIQLRL